LRSGYVPVAPRTRPAKLWRWQARRDGLQEWSAVAERSLRRPVEMVPHFPFHLNAATYRTFPEVAQSAGGGRRGRRCAKVSPRQRQAALRSPRASPSRLLSQVAGARQDALSVPWRAQHRPLDVIEGDLEVGDSGGAHAATLRRSAPAAHFHGRSLSSLWMA
jgi:hypothetical protein